jgi:hypothetical protein
LRFGTTHNLGSVGEIFGIGCGAANDRIDKPLGGGKSMYQLKISPDSEECTHFVPNEILLFI